MPWGLRQSLDLLASPSTDLADLAGQPTSNIWVNEANPARVWVAVDDTLYRSLDGGATFTAMHAAPDTINWVMEDPAVNNSVFIACGADLLHATDPTVGWVVLYAGPVGATARQFVRSRDGQVTWVCYIDAPSGEALQRVETGAICAIPSTDVRTCELEWDPIESSALLATVYGITGDDPPTLWRADGLTGLDLVASAVVFPDGSTVNHMLHSRHFPVIYIGSSDSVESGIGSIDKYFPTPDLMLRFKSGEADGQQVLMLGLSAATVPYRATILMLPSGASGAADKLFILDARTGVWAGKALPEANRSDWFRIRANPFDSKKLLLLRVAPFPATSDNALYYSDDFGDTWVTVFSNLTTSVLQYLMSADWSPAFGEQWNGARYTGTGYLFRGTNDTYTEVTLASGDAAASPGAAGEALTMDDTGQQYYIDVANTIHTGSTGSLPFGFFFVAPSGRRAAHVRENGEEEVRITQDYTTGAWVTLSGTDARTWIGILADNTIVCGGRFTAMGVQEIADAWGSASVSVAAFAGDEMGALAADAQTHTIAAAVWHPSSASTCAPAVRSPAGGWSLLPRPPDATDLADVIEVVGR